jgi:ribosome-binding factor A
MSRKERVESLIQEEICDILREKVSDPRIGFITVTSVKVSPDFKNASIYVSIFGEENVKKDGMAGLSSATGFIQHELGQMLEMRATPLIRFVRDDSIEKGSRVLGIIKRLESDKNSRKDKKSRKRR